MYICGFGVGVGQYFLLSGCGVPCTWARCYLFRRRVPDALAHRRLGMRLNSLNREGTRNTRHRGLCAFSAKERFIRGIAYSTCRRSWAVIVRSPARGAINNTAWPATVCMYVPSRCGRARPRARGRLKRAVRGAGEAARGPAARSAVRAADECAAKRRQRREGAGSPQADAANTKTLLLAAPCAPVSAHPFPLQAALFGALASTPSQSQAARRSSITRQHLLHLPPYHSSTPPAASGSYTRCLLLLGRASAGLRSFSALTTPARPLARRVCLSAPHS